MFLGLCRLFILFSILTFANAAQELTKLRELYKLKIGETLVYAPTGYSVTLTAFQKYESKCAVPGYNCGSGYMPGVQVTPLFDVKYKEACDVPPLASECELTHRVLKSDNETYVEVEFLNIFDSCENYKKAASDKESDFDNWNSCIIQTVKNGPYKAAFDPKNCERIQKPLASRDACYEAVADDHQNPKICDLIKGAEGFQCVLLRARTSKDPEICRSLKRSHLQRSDVDYKDQIASCLNAVKLN